MTAELSLRALNRATLARQLLLRRADMPVADAVAHLVGLQAQAPFPPYYALWTRLRRFRPGALARLLTGRQVVRIVLMRGTVHLVGAADALLLRPMVQPIMDRDLHTNTTHRDGLAGVDHQRLAAAARELLAERPRTTHELGPLLAQRFPGHPAAALAHGARNLLPLAQLPPRGVWGASGRPVCDTLESWLGQELAAGPSIDAVLLRYLAAFGPASVTDAQTWSGLTRLRAVFDRLRPRLRTFRDERGRELFDLPDAPRPDPDTPAPPRFLAEFDTVLLSHADRTRIIGDEHRKRLFTRNGVFPGTVTIDGFVRGSWRIVRGRGEAVLRIEPYAPMSTKDSDRLVREGHRLLSFAAADTDTHDVQLARA